MEWQRRWIRFIFGEKKGRLALQPCQVRPTLGFSLALGDACDGARASATAGARAEGLVGFHW